jgi:hypothetical protein
MSGVRRGQLTTVTVHVGEVKPCGPAARVYTRRRRERQTSCLFSRFI